MAHAKLSPSGSSRWMVCPGSVHLAEGLPEEPSSKYAARGTAIHELSEMCLIKGLEPSSFIGSKVYDHIVDAEMAEIANVYVSWIREAQGKKMFETKLSLEEVIPDCFGTADALIMRPGHLTMADLKTGSGVKVDADGNTQLLCYALGAFLKYDWVYDFQTITVVIVQPPLNHIDTWTITRDDLLQFRTQLRDAYDRIVSRPDTFVLSEKGCQWCRVKVNCPEQQRLAAEAAAADFATLSVDELAQWLDKLPHLKSFIEGVENRAKERLLDGQPVEGWKVVEGRRSRSWKDEKAVEAYLKSNGYQQLIYSKPKLLTVAQMETALKKESVNLEPFIEVSAGNPTLARVDDRRSSVDKAAQAAKDFSMA